MYQDLQGMKANLYKCFITRAWDLGSQDGIAGFLHPEGPYDDPKGGRLRAASYPRLKGHYQFINELCLFVEVDHHAKYSVNVFACQAKDNNRFCHISNLFHPSTIDGCLTHDGLGAVPGIKTDDNHWDTRPHRSRVIEVSRQSLEIFARLYDEAGTPLEQARLPVLHSREIVAVLEKIANQAFKVGDLEGGYFATVMFDETASQRDGSIRRETCFPKNVNEWIISGPHFYIGTPFNKTPNEGCSHNLDYSEIDLSAIPEDYLPRTNYVSACTPAEYALRIPRWKGTPVTAFYRHINREMLSPTGERTLIATIIPPGPAHINTVFSLCFCDLESLLLFSGYASSLLYDFSVKTAGVGHINVSHISALPLPSLKCISHTMMRRVLRLNCLTNHYSGLWASMRIVLSEPDGFALTDPRCTWPVYETPEWCHSCAFRSDYGRRQAFVELDALAALSLDLVEEELITIYRIQFPVLRQYERENLYDQTGRLVPKGVLDLAKLHNVDIRQRLNVSTFTGPLELIGEVETPGLGVTGGIVWEDPKMEPRMKRVYPPPFTKCDREADMRQAYRAFQERLRSTADTIPAQLES